MKKIYFNVNETKDKILIMQYILIIGFFNCSFNHKPEQKTYINLNNNSLLIINWFMSYNSLINFSRDLKNILNHGLTPKMKKHYKLI